MACEVDGMTGFFSSLALPFFDFEGSGCSTASATAAFESPLTSLSSFFDFTTSATLRGALIGPSLVDGFSFSFGVGFETWASTSASLIALAWSRTLEPATLDFFVGVS